MQNSNSKANIGVERNLALNKENEIMLIIKKEWNQWLIFIKKPGEKMF